MAKETRIQRTETRIQRKKTAAYNNGMWVHIGNFDYDILTGEVSGNVHYVPVKANVNPATEYKRGMAQEAQRALLKAAGVKIEKPTTSAIKETHVKNLGNGMSLASGIVNGETVQLAYNGSVDSAVGTADGKPWLGQVRKDLLSIASQRKVSKGKVVVHKMVDVEFINRLIEKGFNVGPAGVMIEGKTIDILWMSQVEAVKAIENRLDEIKRDDENAVNDFFDRW